MVMILDVITEERIFLWLLDESLYLFIQSLWKNGVFLFMVIILDVITGKHAYSVVNIWSYSLDVIPISIT
jgi:hypothetical protein